MAIVDEFEKCWVFKGQLYGNLYSMYLCIFVVGCNLFWIGSDFDSQLIFCCDTDARISTNGQQRAIHSLNESSVQFGGTETTTKLCFEGKTATIIDGKSRK